MTPHPPTIKSIEKIKQHEPGKLRVWRCGCQFRCDHWRLCPYHQGYDDAIADQWATVVEHVELYGQVWLHVKDGHA